MKVLNITDLFDYLRFNFKTQLSNMADGRHLKKSKNGRTCITVVRNLAQ